MRQIGDARSRSSRKSSIYRSILGRSRPRLAGSHAFCVLQGVAYSLDFIFQISAITLFELSNKFITIESDVIYGAVGPPGKHPNSGMAVGELSHDRCRIPDFGRLIDRNSDTKQKTSIPHLIMYCMTTNNTYDRYSYNKIISQGCGAWEAVFTPQLVGVCGNLKMRIVRGG